MEVTELRAAIESILFACGEPVPVARMAEALESDTDAVIAACDALAASHAASDSALMVVRLDDSYQMCTKGAHADIIRQLLEIRRNTPLSQAAMEVLAVIAYNQPVTKAFVEQVRGVDCSGVVGSLCVKGLVAEQGRLELPGRPLLYGTTPDFLRCFGLSSLADLPPLPEPERPAQGEDRVAESHNTADPLPFAEPLEA